MDIKIRTARLEDYASLLELFEQGDAHHRQALPGLFHRPPGPAREMAYWEFLVSDPLSAVFLAELDGEPVGLVVVQEKETPRHPLLVPRRFALIDNIVVQAGLRGRGIGRALMNQAEIWAAGRDLRQLELNVYEFNESAARLYESLGYTVISRRMGKDL